MASLALIDDSEADPSGRQPGGGRRAAAWTFYAFTAAASLWLFLYASGIHPWLGFAEGSARHGAAGVRVSDDSSGGLSTMLLFKGQKAIWDYDVQVEGSNGVRLRVAATPPQRGFIVRMQRIEATGRGRFEVVVPATGLYRFDYELEPLGTLAGPARPGSVRYRLHWGAQ
jgi:hypothetical protein